MEAVFYKGSTVIHTSKHGEVCVVIFEIFKINCVCIEVCQDPALLFCHKALNYFKINNKCKIIQLPICWA